ncbi:hypothetical protein FB45DRAFT_274420 [Roridomyces roridus]|uniref:HMG box domain-containing protein n=1 Tax=Roridomyces roridus TaxID=1738132 RepID=A0AAD7FB41_9AGAR|nr:hypothetical protein FB45DRAFT_274420 [Roridomyces roridus]
MPALRTRDTHPAVRSLEVNTSVPPPSLTIISPTPRAFTFPISHNLADSPYSSPSNSPFEPDLRALDLSSSSTTPSSSVDDQCCPRTPPPLSAYTRTLSPSETSSPSRRKSTSGEERRPKKGDDDYVKRPENAFILFRRKCCEDRALGISTTSASAPSSLAAGPSSADSPALASNGKKQRQADLSKTISQQWKALSVEQRSHWEQLAKEKKKEHEALHPNYVYRPQRANKNRAATSSSSSAAKRKNSAPAPAQDIEFVVPAPRGHHGRSASAPTPPPYQSIRMPNVYFGAATPESPTSLMPMISRRGSASGSQSSFDYMPSFGAAVDFEASLQSSDFLRAMFPAGGAESSMLSPASSASGSGPSSPYTPASASFHPSAYAATPYAGGNPSDFSLDGPAPIGSTQPAEDYAAYASVWATTSPWAAAPSAASGFAEGDFDISRIPELGWDLSCGTGAAPQGELELAYPIDFGMDMGAADEGSVDLDLGGNGLDLHFGMSDDLSVSEMGFDEMMTGAGF